MPTGFIGEAARGYLDMVDVELKDAIRVHDDFPFMGLSELIVAFPTLPLRHNETMPHPPETAGSGGNITGSNSANNIVVDDAVYSEIFVKADQIDDGAGRELYNIAVSIETLCQGSFVMPRTTQKSDIITAGLKNSLGEFRSLMGDTLVDMRRFVNAILAIG